MNYYHIQCKELGFRSCENITSGNSEEELMRKFLFHTMVSHHEEFEEMCEEEKMELSKTIHDIITKQNYN